MKKSNGVLTEQMDIETKEFKKFQVLILNKIKAMTPVKLKKDIPNGVFIILKDSKEVKLYNKKYKVSEMFSNEAGILTFPNEASGVMTKWLKERGVVITKGDEPRKRLKDGKYNRPIVLKFKPKETSLDYIEKFLKETMLTKNEPYKKDGWFHIDINIKSKGSILNILTKLSRKNHGKKNLFSVFSFGNMGELIIINQDRTYQQK